MASNHPIPAFPANIDRNTFGHWLSGFVDGEGCFTLRAFRRERPNVSRLESFVARFLITLRSDDVAILESIRSYWQCGRIRLHHRKTKSRPLCRYEIQRSADLQEIIVPHFEAYPLRAKKRRDFMIWKRAVSLLYQVSERPRIRNRGRLCDAWSDAERDEFAHCIGTLRSSRSFDDLTG